MSAWSPVDLLPGLYVALLFALLLRVLRRWYDPVPPAVAAAFAAVLLALFAPVLFGGKLLLPLDGLRGQAPFRALAPTEPFGNPLQGDLITLVAPSAVAVRGEWAAGRWPLWNPRAGAGLPLLADPQAQALQPLVLAAYPFPYPRAAAVTAALRVLVALVFTFLLLRRQSLAAGAALAGAFAYGLGGFVMLWLGWPLANTAALLPLVLYALVRCAQRADESFRARDHLLLALALAALLLAGHPETIVDALTFAALFLADLVARRPAGTRARLLRDTALAAAIAAGLAAPHLLLAARALPASLRAERLREPATAGAAALAGGAQSAADDQHARLLPLLPIAAPNAFGNSRVAAYWGPDSTNEDAGGFAGTATLLAMLAGVAVAARRRLPQEGVVAAATAASLAVIARPALLARWEAASPAVRAVATPRLALVAGFGLAYLGACGLEHLRRGDLRGSRRGEIAVVLGAAAALAGLIAWAYLAHPAPRDPAILAVFRLGWLRWQLRFLAAAALVLVALPRRSLAPAAVALLLAAELVLLHRGANPPSPRRLAFPLNAATRFLATHLGLDRMAALGPAFPPNLPSLYGLADARAYNPVTPWAYVQATAPITAAWRGESPEFGNLATSPAASLYRRLGVRYLLTAPEAGCPPGTTAAFHDDSAWICELPRPQAPLFLTRPPAGGGGVRITDVETDRIGAWVGTPAGSGAAALASTRYQDGGWRPIVDGSVQPTAHARGPFAAARIEGIGGDGRAVRRVELVYRPAGFLAGCLAAALALAAAAARWCPPPRI